MEATEEVTKAVPRRSHEEKARDIRVAAATAEVRAIHGEEVELVFSLWGPELYIDVYKDGKNIQRYEHIPEEDSGESGYR
jgi:hypothetical protein